MIDAHCHLDLYPDPVVVAREAVKHGVFVVSVTTTPAAWYGTKKLAAGHDSIVTALGMHPQLVATRAKDVEQFESLVPEASWLGEVGLDGTLECRDSLAAQTDIFACILKASSRAGGRVLSIHSRGAASAVLNELRAHPDAGTAVLHWFSGTLRELHDAIELGCWFSVGEPMIRSKRGRALIERMPRHRILTETDGPFVQSNGQPVHPWNVVSVERALAEYWRRSVENVSEQLYENLMGLQAR